MCNSLRPLAPLHKSRRYNELKLNNWSAVSFGGDAFIKAWVCALTVVTGSSFTDTKSSDRFQTIGADAFEVPRMKADPPLSGCSACKSALHSKSTRLGPWRMDLIQVVTGI
jgi:hypothetical protein